MPRKFPQCSGAGYYYLSSKSGSGDGGALAVGYNKKGLHKEWLELPTTANSHEANRAAICFRKILLFFSPL